MDALDHYCHGGSDQEDTNHKCGEGFGFPMTVGVIGIRRFDGNLEAKIDDQTTDNVRKRLQSIRDESKGVAGKACDSFSECKDEVDEHSK